MSGDLIARVRRFAARHQLWTRDARVVAAVSGGSDSVAMLFVLRDLALQGELVLVGLAHLNHRIRGDDADADVRFCRDLAARLELPAFIGEADVPALAAASRASLELAGRDARQQFYMGAMRSAGAAAVAVAHTRDDQAETVLLRLTRGAGSVGLSGIAPRRGPIIRPVLETTRSELREYLDQRHEGWREDATNADRTVPRNLIRHDVLPLLRTINPQADAALARAADSLRADADFLETLANAAFLRTVELPRAGLVTIDAVRLTDLPRPVALRVARFALETANPSQSYGLEEARVLCDFGAGCAVVALPGLGMERSGGKVVLRNSKVRRVHPFELHLPIPGVASSPQGRWAVEAEGPMPSPTQLDRGSSSVVVDARELGAALVVRARRPGDRLHPLGAPGRRKVQDVLVDRKVPRDDRDLVPIVTTESGRIVWVAGQALAEPFRVTSFTESVVVLTLRRI